MSEPPPNDRTEELFHQALDLPPGERDVFVDSAAAGDQAVALRVKQLLAAHHAAEAAMPTPPCDGAATAAATHDEDVLLGTRLNGYLVKRVLGAGGMGTVYHAQQESPRRHVALKVLHAGGLSREATYRFRLEAQVLASLEHPCIAHVYEAGFAPVHGTRVPYLAMELVEGSTLLEYVRVRKPEQAALLAMFSLVCAAVEHAHRKGVIHRDLKPGNIMVGESGQPKILDFGVARLINYDEQSAPARTQAGQIIGTLQYMSPEQAAGDPREIDTRTDVYSLGVILFQMLSLELPYDVRSTSVAQAAAIIKDNAPRTLGTVLPQFKGDLETIVAKALEKEPARRYQSAAELAADIARYLAHQPILARPASRAYLIRKFIRRNRAITVLCALILISLVGGFTGISLAMRRAIVAKHDADAAHAAESAALTTSKGHEQRAIMHAAQAEFQSYVANIAAASAAVDSFDVRTARRFLDLCPAHLRQWEWSYLRQRLTDDLRGDMFPPRATAPDGYLWSIRTSADGQWIAASNASVVRLWNPVTGQRRDFPMDRPGNPHSGDTIHGVSLSGDGSLLACAHAWNRVATVWDLRSGRLLHEFAGHSDEVEDVAISPDGKTLVTAGYDSTVGIYDVASGVRLHTLHGHSGRVQSVAFSHDATRICSCASDGVVRTWEVRSGAIVSATPVLGSVFVRAAFSPDDTLLAVAGANAAPVIVSVGTGQVVRRLDAETRDYASIAWSNDARTIAIGADDRIVRLFDAATGAAVARLRGHEHTVSNLLFLPGRDLLVSAGISDPGGIRVWSTHAAPWPRSIKGHPGDVEDLRFSPDSSRLVSIGSRWSTALVHDVRSGDVLGVLRSPLEQAVVTNVERSGEIELLTKDYQIENWPPQGRAPTLRRVSRDAATPQASQMALETIRLFGPLAAASAAGTASSRDERPDWRAISPTGAFAARFAGARGVEVVRVSDNAVVAVLEGVAAPVRALLVGDAPILVVASGADLHLLVVGAASQEPMLLRDAANEWLSADVSPDQRRLVLGYTSGEVRFIDLPSATLVYTIKLGVRWIERLAFSPDGTTLAAGESSGTIRLLETTPRQSLHFADPLADAADRLIADRARRATPLNAMGEDIPAELSSSIDAAIRRYEASPQGTMDWCLGLVAQPGTATSVARRAQEVLGALMRIDTRGTRLYATAALASLRRHSRGGPEEASLDVTSLETAASRLETARTTLAQAAPADRALFAAVERLIARAKGQIEPAAAIIAAQFSAAEIHPASSIRILLDEAK